MTKAVEGLFHHLNLTVHSFLILANVDNNGGDGFCLAKLISDYDGTKKIHIHICTDKKPLILLKTPEVAHYYSLVKKLQNVTMTFLDDNNIEAVILWTDIIIDCIFGIGYHGKIPPAIALKLLKKLMKVKNIF